MKTWALVIMLFGGSDGGRVVSTDLRFSQESTCREAIVAIHDAANRSRMSHNPVFVCVRIE